uniref:Aminotransferase class I/classII large domain-containing protein n=1 Tax=Dunaliella tertiolecta TaxID=3047 RepID=A0A7S3VSG2_DUNTE
MKVIAGKSLMDFHNQYPPMLGLPELREAVAAHSLANQGIACDPASEVVITSGATEGIAACMLGLLNPGDEVIILDPCYDSYVGMAHRAGGVVKPLRLRSDDMSIPLADLEKAFGPKTKLIMFNSPHNPSGKVFSHEEMQAIARLCIQHDVIAVCDEVYEHLTLNGTKHVSLRTLPGMAERSIRLGSAGKTFSFTAWKVGWMTGPSHLLAPIIKAHQFLVFTVPSNLQRAVAHGLNSEANFYRQLGEQLSKKRALLEQPLRDMGFNVLPGEGAYFLVADASKFLRPTETDVDFCQRLTIEAGVTLIPISGFYVSPDPPKQLVRFAFCKDDSKLNTALDKLRAYLLQ